LAAVLATGYLTAQSARQGPSAPITIQKQGSFAVGGTILGDPATKSLHCDHGYVDYQIPVNPRRINLVMWHSAAADRLAESMGRRRGLPRASSCAAATRCTSGTARRWAAPTGAAPITPTRQATGRDQGNFTAWRFGAQYPNWFEGVQFPTKDAEAWNQASRARYLEFDSVENAQLQSDAAARLMDRIGPSVALTNSAGGLRAILTGLKTNNLAGIVMYENVGYVYPQGEGPGGPVGRFGPSKCRSKSSRS
jgi:hypothetical protein